MPASADAIDDYLASLVSRPAVQAAVAPPLRVARDAGLPLTYLLAKAKEGVAKRIPPPRLGGVLHALVRHLQASRGLLPAPLAAEAGLVEAGARAMMAGSSRDEVARVIAMADRRTEHAAPDIERLLALLSDLRGLGLESPDTVRLLAALKAHDPSALARGDDVVRTLRHLSRVAALPWSTTVDEIVTRMSGTVNLLGAWRSAVGRHASHVRPWTLGEGPPGGPDGLGGSSAARRSLAPGQSGSAPGLSGQSPGNGGAPPGQSGSTPGRSGQNPGKGSGGGE